MRVQLLPLSERHKGGLALGTRKKPTRPSWSVPPANETALATGFLRVDARGNPDKATPQKLMSPGPGEGNRMPNNSPVPLSDATSARSASSSRRRAPLEGTIHGVPTSRTTPPPSDHHPQPPVPGSGVQLHLGPFAVAPHSGAGDLLLRRQGLRGPDGRRHRPAHRRPCPKKATTSSSTSGSKEHRSRQPASARPAPSTSSPSQRFIIGRAAVLPQPVFFPKVGKFPKTANFDLNSHYINLGRDTTLQAEVYVSTSSSLRRAPVTTFAKAIFETINQTINVPPHEDTDHSCGLPEPREAFQDPALGSNGRVSRETLSTPSARTCTATACGSVRSSSRTAATWCRHRMVYDNLGGTTPWASSSRHPSCCNRGGVCASRSRTPTTTRQATMRRP